MINSLSGVYKYKTWSYFYHYFWSYNTAIDTIRFKLPLKYDTFGLFFGNETYTPEYVDIVLWIMNQTDFKTNHCIDNFLR